MSTYTRRLAVDDLILFILRDGTFQPGRIPVQNTLGKHRMKIKCHDRYDEDLSSDPMYNNLLVKLFPNDGRPTDVLPKDLVILDRNFKIGQLVKQQDQKGQVGKVGYISSFSQIASARIYQPDETKRRDPAHELYLYNKPATFYRDPSRSTLEEGDVVNVDGWLGVIKGVTRDVEFTVDFGHGVLQNAEIAQNDLFDTMLAHGIADTIFPTETRHFDMNGINGIFVGRTFEISYKCMKDNAFLSPSFRWTGSSNHKPGDILQNIRVTITGVVLGQLKVEWKMNEEISGPKPDDNTPLNIRNRFTLNIVTHPKPMKIGDIRICHMDEKDWIIVLNKATWKGCIAKDYFLHKRRGKGPRLDDYTKEILPSPLPTSVAVEIVTTATKVDVIWTDGTVEHGVDSRDLDPIRYQKEFPGSIVLTNEERPRAFNAVGEALTRAVDYSVVQSSQIIRNPEKEKFKLTVQDYRLNPGTSVPVLMGEPRVIEKYEEPKLRMCWLWRKNKPQVVIKINNSQADFSYGCVIGLLPDGRVRIRNENGLVMAVWPTDMIPLEYPQYTNLEERVV